MNEYNAMVIRTLSTMIDKLASGELLAQSVDTCVELDHSFVEYHPLGYPVERIKAGTTRTVTMQLVARSTK